MRVDVRGAIFQIGGVDRSAVTVTVGVPDAYHDPLPQGGCAATLLLNPDEAQRLSVWLQEAATAALDTAPPLYE
jgi:hypothetical protein